MQAAAITTTVGNTPLVKLQNIVPANCADIFVKLEYFNPTGAYKAVSYTHLTLPTKRIV